MSNATSTLVSFATRAEAAAYKASALATLERMLRGAADGSELIRTPEGGRLLVGRDSRDQREHYDVTLAVTVAEGFRVRVFTNGDVLAEVSFPPGTTWGTIRKACLHWLGMAG